MRVADTTGCFNAVSDEEVGDALRTLPAHYAPGGTPYRGMENFMTAGQEKPSLRFAREFTEQDAEEARSRGYLSHVLVEFGPDCLYPVFFYDAVRLQQDLEESTRHGRPFIADPGMIVLEEITRQAMTEAVERLAGEDFFEYLSPVTADDLDASDPYPWPPRRRHRHPVGG